MSGTIKLYHRGEIVRQQSYYEKRDRRRIIDQWRKLYGKAFVRAELIDVPDEVLYGDDARSDREVKYLQRCCI